MPEITLPDGSKKVFEKPVTIKEIAQSIGTGLAKATIAGKVNDVLFDATLPIDNDSKVVIITSRDKEGIEIIRHSFAHLIGHAVKQLYPNIKMAIGPVIDNGFYYDIFSEYRFTPEDLIKIENRIHNLIKKNYDVEILQVTKKEAIKTFQERDETFKLRIIEEIPDEGLINLYKHEEYIDMCRGPHVPNTSHLRHFKLLKLSGSYWRGNSENESLQRIYGTAWAKEKELNDYLTRIEEAEKRDHRKLGKKHSLFHIQEESPGMIFWHPNGWTIYQVLEKYVREILNKNDYLEIKTPQAVDKSLWEKSGHWDKFREDMFTTASENRTYAIKPMNCPCHIQVFNQGLKSYKDLPIRLAEFGSCHRNEPSGALHGLMRVRNFTQDDAHIFCTEEQIQAEVSTFIDLVFEVYKTFGFDEIIIKLSTRPDVVTFALFNAQPATAKLQGRTGGIPIENFRDLPGTNPAIKYYDMKGGGGDSAVPFPKGTRVAVHYDLKFRSLTIASSRVGAGVTGGTPYGFNVGTPAATPGGPFLPAFNYGIQGMGVGTVRRMLVPAEYAYGNNQVQEIPPNSEVTLDLELLSIAKTGLSK